MLHSEPDDEVSTPDEAIPEDPEILDPGDPSVPDCQFDGVCDSDPENNPDNQLNEDDFPLENFISELEHRMVCGESSWNIKSWSKKQGIDDHQRRRYEKLIRSMWQIEGTTTFVLQRRRDEYRQMYREIYRREMNSDDGDMKLALKTVEAMAKLDGLMAPEIIMAIPAAGTSGQLTNRTRERTQELLQMMRDRAERGAAIATKKISESPHSIAERITGQAKSDQNDDHLQAPSPMVMGVVK